MKVKFVIHQLAVDIHRPLAASLLARRASLCCCQSEARGQLSAAARQMPLANNQSRWIQHRDLTSLLQN